MMNAEELRQAGFNNQDIQPYLDKQAGQLLDAGFSQEEVMQHVYGVKTPDDTGIRKMVDNNLQQTGKPLSFVESAQAGFQSSATGLLVRGKLPEKQLTGNEPWYDRAASAVTQTVSDLPEMVAGAVVGGAGGLETGPGATITAAGGAFALPAGMRAVLIDSYQNGDFKNFRDFWDRTLDITKETAKGYVTGAATALSGMGAGAILGRLGAGAATQVAGKTAAEITGMTTATHDLNLEKVNSVRDLIPSAQEFLDSAIVMFGMKGAMEGGAYLRDMYAKNGIAPDKVVAAARIDPSIAQEVAAVNGKATEKSAPEQVNAENLKTAAQRISTETGANVTLEDGANNQIKIAGIQVPDTEQNQGKGTSALELVKDYADNTGRDVVLTAQARTPDEQAALERFYEKNGFVKFGEDPLSKKPYYGYKAQEFVAPEASADVNVNTVTAPPKPETIYMKVPKEPPGLADWVKSNGGLLASDAADIKSVLGGAKYRPGLISRNGTGLDDLAVRAWEKGYFPEKTERPTANEFLDRLSEDLKGKAQYSREHQGIIDARNESVAYNNEVDRLADLHGISTANKTRATFWDEIANKMSQEQRDAEISDMLDSAQADYDYWQRKEKEWLESRGEAWEPEQVQNRTLEDLENEYKQEKLAGVTPEGKEGFGEPESASGNQTGVSGIGGTIQDRAGATGGRSAQQRILDKISIGESGNQRRGVSWDRFYTSTVDKLDPIRRMTEAMAGNDTASAIENSYKLMRLLPGAGGKAQQFLENGTFDFKTLQNNGKSLSEVIAPVKDDLNGLRAYAASKRALELEARDIRSGMPVEAAKQVVSEGAAKYDPIMKELAEYQTRTLQYLRDAGVLSDKAYDAMKQVNQEYVPFYRVMDQEQSGLGVGARVKNPVKSIKGSERAIIDPIESIIRNTYAYITMAERNAAVKSFFDMASREQDAGQYFEMVPQSFRATTISDKEMTDYLRKNGIIDDANADMFRGSTGVSDSPDNPLTVFRAMRAPLAKDEVGYFDAGRWQVAKVDPDMAQAFNGTPRASHGLLFSLLRAPAALLRSGLVTPEFIIRHLERNQLSASILAEKGNIPFYDTFKGMMSYLGKDEDYQNWLKSGGQISAPTAIDRDTLQDEIRKLTGDKQSSGVAGTAWNIAKTPFDVLHAIQQSLEAATRLGAFKRAMNGLDVTKENIIDSGYYTRNIAPDPARIGSATANWNAITALFNTEIQHTDQLVAALRDRPLPTLAKIFAGVTIPSALLWMANHDKQEWKEAHQWERDFFWLVPMGGFTLRIPKPFLLGELFGSGVERLLDKVSGADSDNRGLEHFMHDLSEWGVPNVIPTAIAPVLEQITNYSFFKGGQLVPDHLMEMMPEYRYTPYTSELTKALSRIVGYVPYVKDTSLASPPVIDNYLYKWTGGLGTYALSVADAGLRKAGILPDPALPTRTLADIPVIKGFVVRYPSATADSIERFQEDYHKRAEVYNTYNNLLTQGDADAALKVMQQNPAAMAKLDSINRALSQQNQLVRLIYKNPDIPADEKRQLIDSTYFNMIDMSRAGNEAMKELDESMNKNIGTQQ